MSILPITRVFLAVSLGLSTFTSQSFSQTSAEQQQSLEREHQKHLDRLRARDAKNKEADDTKPRPLTSEELIGEWTALKIGDAEITKTRIKIKSKEEGSKQLVLEGKYKDWEQEGEVTDGKIVFVRTPTAEQMSEKAPKWAREDVQNQGKLKWKMELKGERRDKEAHLDGKWFPGELQWRTAKGAHPDLNLPGDRQAQYLGPGKPLEVQLKKPMPKFFLYAKCMRGLQFINEFYLGVPTLVELQFDPEYDADQYPLELTTGRERLKLVAHKIDKKGIIFRTDFFVPGGTKGTP
jgi:hypothetical protein